MEWYYGQDGQQRGPVSQSDFDLLVQSGVVRKSTPVWRTGLQEWTTWGELNGARPSRQSVEVQNYYDPRPGYVEDDVLWNRAPGGPPWEETSSSWIVRLYSTAFKLLFRPLEFYRELGSASGAETSFVACSAVLSTLANTLVIYLFLGGYEQHGPAIMFCDIAKALVIGPILTLISAFITTVLVHLSMLLVGGALNGMGATQRVVFYTLGAMNVVGTVPVLGLIVILAYPILLIVGLQIVHETPLWKAMVAVLLPSMLCCITITAFFGAAITAALSGGAP